MNSKEKSAVVDFMKGISPLGFDIGMDNEYLECFKNDLMKLDHLDELDTLYEGMESGTERMQALDVIGNPNIILMSEMDEDDFVSPP